MDGEQERGNLKAYQPYVQTSPRKTPENLLSAVIALIMVFHLMGKFCSE